MAARIRAFDWSRTPLGPLDRWPQSLRVAVDIMLTHPMPMILMWGPHLTQIYNDGYAAMAGGKHPAALGQPTRECWPEVWHLNAPIYERVLRGEPVQVEDQLFPIARHGAVEDAWFSLAFGPLRDDSGRISGFLLTATETTARVLAQRERSRLQSAEAMREHEAEYRSLFEAMDEGFLLAEVIFDAQQRPVDLLYLAANPAAIRMTRADYVGRRLMEIDPNFEAQWVEIWGRVARTGVGERHKRYAAPLDTWFDFFVFRVGGEDSRRVAVVFSDISDRVRVELALRASEERATAIIDSIADGFVAMDREWRLTYVNSRAEEILRPGYGRTKEEMLGRTQWELFPETLGTVVEESYRRAMRDGVPVAMELFYPPLNAWFDLRAYPSRDGLSVYFLDISDRKRAEEALRESGRRFRALVNASADVVYRMSADWSEMRHLDGRGFIADTGSPVTSWSWLDEYIHPDDQPLVTAAIREAIRTKGMFQLEHRVRRVDGTLGWTFSRAVPLLDPSGEVTEWIGAASDVTQRKEAEEALREAAQRFRFLAESMPQKMFTATSSGDVDYFNQQWTEFTGLSFEQIRDWGWLQFIYPDDVEENVRVWKHSIETAEPFQLEHRFRRRDGVYRWHLSRAHAMRDAEGKVRMWIGSNTDIDDVKRTEEALRQAKEEAERASRMKDEFLATLGHELRTPLNAILGWSQILASGSRDEDDLAEGLRTIERNARAQTQIIEDLLDMSRIISGKVRLDVQRVDLGELVRLAVETAKPSADAKGIRLQAVLDPKAGPVSGDPNRLQQVFWNLLSNAVKFTPKGGRVQVLLERVNSHVEVSVMDTGEGISPEFLPHVFDRFRQADATTTRRHGGLGLGLSIVKQLVELHGGSVRVKSLGTGHGATFTVALPLTVVHPEPEPAVERRHPSASSSSVLLPDNCADIAGVKVLVVDDEPDARALVKRLLEDCGAKVFTAGSAAEAVKRMRVERPDVLLSDIGMPDEDGYSLIRRVRALGPERGGNVPAVALTAYARSEDRTRSILAGFQMHIAKPVEPSELIAMVASLAGRTR